jgi:simple sugar transport system permease protein/ribose transport system permease protein
MSGEPAAAGQLPRPRRTAPGAALLRHGTLAALALLFAFNAAVTPNFLELQTLFVNLSQVAPVAIVAVGMTFVIATKGIDLSVGAVMALSGAIGAMILQPGVGPENPALRLAAAIGVPLLVAATCGVFNGTLVAVLRVQPIIATLILFISGRGLALVLSNGNLQTFSDPLFRVLGTGRVLGLPLQAWLALVIALVAAFVISRTLFGRRLLAVGGNETAARLSAVPVTRVLIVAYVISAVLAGLAGLISISINSASDAARNGLLMELDAIAAAVVGGAALSGGRAPILGVVVGALFIQLVRYTILANGMSDEVALIVKAAIIVLAVWLQQLRRER